MINMKRSYFYIDGRHGVRRFEYDGPFTLFETWDEASAAEDAQKAERIAQLRAELAALEQDE